jgi:hypothetical protein
MTSPIGRFVVVWQLPGAVDGGTVMQGIVVQVQANSPSGPDGVFQTGPVIRGLASPQEVDDLSAGSDNTLVGFEVAKTI